MTKRKLSCPEGLACGDAAAIAVLQLGAIGHSRRARVPTRIAHRSLVGVQPAAHLGIEAALTAAGWEGRFARAFSVDGTYQGSQV